MSTHDKKEGWDRPCNKMENDLLNFDPDYEFDRDCFFNNVHKIMSIKFFNRIKQFMIRLYRNNLFLGHSPGKGAATALCYAYETHKESRRINGKLPRNK